MSGADSVPTAVGRMSRVTSIRIHIPMAGGNAASNADGSVGTGPGGEDA